MLVEFLGYNPAPLHVNAHSRFEVQAISKPLIPRSSAIAHGFEGGRVLKIGSTYHAVVNEMHDDLWTEMEIAHYSSPDGDRWHRDGTLVKSVGIHDGTDSRNSTWATDLQFKDGYWELHYVGYQKNGVNGRIYKATSMLPGVNGIYAPFITDSSPVMEPSITAPAWEGDQGIDSFMPYSVGFDRYALYGSHQYGKDTWQVGLAKLTAAGWQRVSDQPLGIGLQIENPIVQKASDGWVATYDSLSEPNTIGFSFSQDGIHWSQGQSVTVPIASAFTTDIRTPLGLIEESPGVYSVFFTSRDKDAEHWSFRRMTLTAK